MSQLKICPQCGTEYELDQRFCPKDGTTLRMQGSENDLVGSIIADRYHVLRKLGEGGMGQVYLAEHVKMGRKSAVKVMNPGMVNDADAISRFNREASNASRINHPNVAAVYDFGETGEGLIYLAMEFVEGPPLTKLIEQLGALPPLRAADICRQAADALSVAHDMGIVHRDLKPDNIMVAKNRDGSDLVKVVDFGIAKAADNEAQKVTKTGLVVGTPEYMSPEQLAGDKLDGRSDIYSLALVAFNMLTGKLPFPSESAQEAMIMRLTDKPRPLAEMKPDTAWTDEVQAVMDKALERDAAQRYQGAAQFGRDLYQTVEAMPQSVAAAAGTQVMGAAAGAGSASAPTAAIPATRVAGAADRPGAKPTPAPTPAGKSKAPLFATIAAVVLLGGGGGAWYMLKDQAPATNPGTPPVTHTAADSNNKGDAEGVKTPANSDGSSSGTEQFRDPRQTNPGNSPRNAGGSSDTKSAGRGAEHLPAGTRPAPATPQVDVDAELARYEDVITGAKFDKPAALGLIKSMDGLSGKLTSPVQEVRAAIIRATAEEVLGRHAAGCQMLQAVKDKALTTSYISTVNAMLSTCN
ncbi:MAG TPA: serine/threonine-protein kinase [Gemmatimonadaceae bacterium]|nr:serine/threonine-protein kinase [Gemmatimonadaceae bacterium]